jgi:voltage-gated potassium channel
MIKAMTQYDRKQYPEAPWKRRLYVIIFESDTPAGKAFDVLLLVSIVLSIVVVSLDSISEIRAAYGPWLVAAEWTFTILFSIEYVLRLLCTRRPLAYARSFFGVVDLISILPTYLALFIPGSHYLLVVRILRLMRVFRILKLVGYLEEASILWLALKASTRKVSVFLLGVITVVVIIGTAMYMVEGNENGFTSIPRGIYWAVVTLTTVGYGDLVPVTPQGRALATLLMLVGYGIIAVPTGIVTNELSRIVKGADTGSDKKPDKEPDKEPKIAAACPVCGRDGHDADATYCKYCGEQL